MLLLIIGITLVIISTICSIISYKVLNRTFKQMDDFVDAIKEHNMELDRYSNELFHGDWYK